MESVKSFSRPVTSRKEKAQIATISAHDNCILGDLVADAMEKIGAEGVVSVEEAKGCGVQLEILAWTLRPGNTSTLVEAGIIDPTKVVRLGLENAVSASLNHHCGLFWKVQVAEHYIGAAN